MVNWLTNLAGVCCIIGALIQTRRTFVYLDIPKSATRGKSARPSPALIGIAIEKAISYFIVGVLFLISPWPKVVIYVLFVFLLRALLNLFLSILSVGRFDGVELTSKEKIHQILSQTVSVIVYILALLALGDRNRKQILAYVILIFGFPSNIGLSMGNLLGNLFASICPHPLKTPMVPFLETLNGLAAIFSALLLFGIFGLTSGLSLPIISAVWISLFFLFHHQSRITWLSHLLGIAIGWILFKNLF